MLTVFLIVLPAVLIPETARGVGRAVVGAGVAGGRTVVEGARSPVLGVVGIDLLIGTDRPPVLFRVLPMGSAGSATVGGPIEGRDGLGSEADMIALRLPGLEGSTFGTGQG